MHDALTEAKPPTMPDARTIISGEPGTYWHNDTGRPWYQLVCSLINTCGICYQYHMQLSRYWAIPLHRGCRCRIAVVKVGREAPHPFCDYEKLVKGLGPPEQAKVMGASLFKLWTKGVIAWEEAVTPGRIRSLEEVVGRRGLSVKTMVKAGVRPDVARQAYGAVHTPEHEAVVAHRKRLLQEIAGAGVNHEALIGHLAGAMKARVGIEAGPSYTTRAADVLPGIAAGRLADPAEFRSRHASELAALLIAWPKKKRAAISDYSQIDR